MSDQECHSFDVWLNGFEMLSVVYGGFQSVTYKWSKWKQRERERARTRIWNWLDMWNCEMYKSINLSFFKFINNHVDISIIQIVQLKGKKLVANVIKDINLH